LRLDVSEGDGRAGSDFIETFWKKRFPGQIPENLVGADELEGDRFELEGEELVAVDLGHTDADDTTALHVPSIGLVVAGDAAYNDVHLYLAESDAAGRRSWLAALDTIEKLSPRAVVAGHKRTARADDPAILEETPAVHPRLRGPRGAHRDRPRALHRDDGPLPRPCQPRSAVGFGPRGEGLTMTHVRY
jgi:hypothetical protein